MQAAFIAREICLSVRHVPVFCPGRTNILVSGDVKVISLSEYSQGSPPARALSESLSLAKI